MFRISTSQIYRTGLNQILRRQAEVTHSQNQLASGKRLLSPSDDPVGAGRSLALTESLSRLDRYDRNLDVGESRLSLQESVLTLVQDSVQRIRELVLQANSAALDDEARGAIATELSAKVEELLQLSNSRDANGEYLFSGTASGTPAFTADFNYQGNNERRFVAASDGLQLAMTDPGSEIFADIPTGNGTFQAVVNDNNNGSAVVGLGAVTDFSLWVPDTYSVRFLTPDSYEVLDSSGGLVASGTYESPSNITFRGINVDVSGTPAAGDTFEIQPSTSQSIFQTVENLAVGLVDGNLGSTARTNLINRELANLDQAINRNLTVRADIGARLNTVESYRALNSGQRIELESARSRIEDADYAETISRMQLELTSLDAAQQSFLTLRGLSLFNLLR